jgi:Zn-finger nucleic acid-binding protein
MNKNIIIEKIKNGFEKVLKIREDGIEIEYAEINEAGVYLDREQLNKIVAICKEKGLINEH